MKGRAMAAGRSDGFEVVGAGVLFGEGPVWCPEDDSVVCVAVASGLVHRVLPGERRTVVIADVGGGPNAAAPAVGGGFLITQNGGIDFSIHDLPGFDSLPPTRPRTPGLQHVKADGSVSLVATHDRNGAAMVGPNDLVTMPDGTMYFTDPGHFPLPPEPAGRVLRLNPDGTIDQVAGGFTYCNGIARDHLGRLLIVEGNGLMYMEPDGATDWFIEDLGGVAGDGFAVDVEGNAYVCCPGDDRVRVVTPDGAIEEFIHFPEHSFPTNCCFGGSDNRSLFVTLSVAQTVVRVEHMPAAGTPVIPWPGPV